MDRNTFYPIYEGTRPYQNNIAILKDYNGQRQKLTYCYKVRQSGVCDGRAAPAKKNTVNEKKLENNLIEPEIQCMNWHCATNGIGF